MSSKYSNFELYKSKYLKYKAKYVTLKNMLGGGVEEDVRNFFFELISQNDIIVNGIKVNVDNVADLIRSRVVIEGGKLIDLKLFNLDLHILPDSIVGLEIMDDLYLQNNKNLKFFPENFAEIKVGKNIHTFGIVNANLLNVIQNIRKGINEREMEKKHQYELSQEGIEERARKEQRVLEEQRRIKAKAKEKEQRDLEEQQRIKAKKEDQIRRDKIIREGQLAMNAIQQEINNLGEDKYIKLLDLLINKDTHDRHIVHLLTGEGDANRYELPGQRQGFIINERSESNKIHKEIEKLLTNRLETIKTIDTIKKLLGGNTYFNFLNLLKGKVLNTFYLPETFGKKQEELLATAIGNLR